MLGTSNRIPCRKPLSFYSGKKTLLSHTNFLPESKPSFHPVGGFRALASPGVGVGTCPSVLTHTVHSKGTDPTSDTRTRTGE